MQRNLRLAMKKQDNNAFYAINLLKIQQLTPMELQATLGCLVSRRGLKDGGHREFIFIAVAINCICAASMIIALQLLSSSNILSSLIYRN